MGRPRCVYKIRIHASKDNFTFWYYPVSRHLVLDMPARSVFVMTRTGYEEFCTTYCKLRETADALVQELGIHWRPWDGKPELLWERNHRKSCIAVMVKLRRLLSRDIACKIAKLIKA
jgi:hypothetical protein